jgi:hypothetical protein
MTRNIERRNMFKAAFQNIEMTTHTFVPAADTVSKIQTEANLLAKKLTT